jgi:hypothetical protein
MLLDMKKTIVELLEAARKLPPGEARQNALKEIGRLRVRLYAETRLVCMSDRQK